MVASLICVCVGVVADASTYFNMVASFICVCFGVGTDASFHAPTPWCPWATVVGPHPFEAPRMV